MVVYIDYIKKNVFISSPKVATTSISKYLNIENVYQFPDNGEFINNDFRKIIIIREDIIERFLSGFYEDLINNYCYDTIDISFHEYLLFLYDCHIKKIPNVNNLFHYLNKDIPIWFGNCSSVSLDITNQDGLFISHIISQKLEIGDTIQKIKGDNVIVVEINNLTNILGENSIICNKKNKKSYDFKLRNIKLCDIKKNQIITNKHSLDEEEREIILKMYNEDVLFINELKNTFNYL
jgi:hypothetical protein